MKELNSKKIHAKTLLYTKDKDLEILNSFKEFRFLEQVDNLDEVSTNEYKVLIVLNIPIDLSLKKKIEKFETKFLILEELDSVSIKNTKSLFDDVYIGNKRNALIKYFSNVLRGLYD